MDCKHHAHAGKQVHDATAVPSISNTYRNRWTTNASPMATTSNPFSCFEPAAVGATSERQRAGANVQCEAMQEPPGHTSLFEIASSSDKGRNIEGRKVCRVMHQCRSNGEEN